MSELPTHRLPSLHRTRAAVVKYDALSDAILDMTADELRAKPTAELERMGVQLEKLAEAVGVAYGLDTAGLNNPDTCAQCIRPGPRVPAPGQELSFVRRMLALGGGAVHEQGQAFSHV